MNGKWIKNQNHLAIAFGNTMIHPNAEEVIILNNGDEVDGVNCEKINDSFSTVRISKIGSEIKAHIFQTAKNEIELELYCERKNKRYSIDIIEGNIIDQIITDDEWFYITGNTVNITQALTNAGILSQGVISIRQYVALLRDEMFMGSCRVQNDVRYGFIDKKVDTDCELPRDITASLYPYQSIGFRWMKYMLEENDGCILGDEMGLGKTLQVITLIQSLNEEKTSPVLVVAPVSLLQNWKRECEKFAPLLDVFIHHGRNRTGRYKELQKHDVIVISYNTAVSDSSILGMIRWSMVVVDEAQNIKTPNSERTLCIKRIPRVKSIAITGTPFENHVSDIWSISDFVIPGFLGQLSEYLHNISDDSYGAEKIEPMLSPIMIRRLVENVAKDLPEKVIIPQPLCMSDTEAIRYEAYRNEIAGNSDKINIGALQKLRMYCTHPCLCDDTQNLFDSSIKYQRFCEILTEVISRNEKAIVFTSFQHMFEVMENDVKQRFGIPIWKINGQTDVSIRQSIVDEFNSFDGSALLILNPTAAGTGLNITSANHVIHFNLEWNPAKEDQATARAYRRGQQKTVFVYRLYYEDTVEQVVNERIDKKRIMAENAVVGTDGTVENREAVLRALSLSPVKRRSV